MLQSGLKDARWIESQNFHITLRFCGDIELQVARELAQQLERVNTEPFEVQLSDLNVFGKSKPHSIYAGVKSNLHLTEMQSSVEHICQKVGMPADQRKFTPHVTLARIRGLKTEEVAKYLSQRGLFQSKSFLVDRFKLYSSRNSIGGGPYVCEETYTLVHKDKAHGKTC